MTKFFDKTIDSVASVLGTQKLPAKRYFDYGIIGISALLGLYLNWEMIYVVLFSLIIWQILHPLSRSALSAISLFLLVLVPLAFYLHRERDAQKLAVLAFGFLVLALLMAVIESKRDKSRVIK